MVFSLADVFLELLPVSLIADKYSSEIGPGALTASTPLDDLLHSGRCSGGVCVYYSP